MKLQLRRKGWWMKTRLLKRTNRIGCSSQRMMRQWIQTTRIIYTIIILDLHHNLLLQLASPPPPSPVIPFPASPPTYPLSSCVPLLTEKEEWHCAMEGHVVRMMSGDLVHVPQQGGLPPGDLVYSSPSKWLGSPTLAQFFICIIPEFLFRVISIYL